MSSIKTVPVPCRDRNCWFVLLMLVEQLEVVQVGGLVTGVCLNGRTDWTHEQAREGPVADFTSDWVPEETVPKQRSEQEEEAGKMAISGPEEERKLCLSRR